MGKRRSGWTLTPLAIALVLVAAPARAQVPGAAAEMLMLRGLQTLSAIQKLAVDRGYEFRHKKTVTCCEPESESDDDEHTCVCPSTNINVQVTVHSTCDHSTPTTVSCTTITSCLQPTATSCTTTTAYVQSTVPVTVQYIQAGPPNMQPGDMFAQPAIQNPPPVIQYVQPAIPIPQPVNQFAQPMMQNPPPAMQSPPPAIPYVQPAIPYVQPTIQNPQPGDLFAQPAVVPQPPSMVYQQSGGHQQTGGHQQMGGSQPSTGHQQTPAYPQPRGFQQPGGPEQQPHQGVYQSSVADDSFSAIAAAALPMFSMPDPFAQTAWHTTGAPGGVQYSGSWPSPDLPTPTPTVTSISSSASSAASAASTSTSAASSTPVIAATTSTTSTATITTATTMTSSTGTTMISSTGTTMISISSSSAATTISSPVATTSSSAVATTSSSAGTHTGITSSAPTGITSSSSSAHTRAGYTGEIVGGYIWPTTDEYIWPATDEYIWPMTDGSISPTTTGHSSVTMQSHCVVPGVAAQLQTGPVSVHTMRTAAAAEDAAAAAGAAACAAAEAGFEPQPKWSEMEPEEGESYRSPVKPRRPEIGETPTATPTAAATAGAGAASMVPSHMAARWRDEEEGGSGGNQPAAGEGIRTAFSETPGVWERLLRPTKTAGLPELLAGTPAGPLEIAAPRGPAPVRAGGVRLDPFRAGGMVGAYRTVELETLGRDMPGKIAEDVWAAVESLSLEEKVGQMTQVGVGALLGADGRVNATAVEYWIDTMKVGAVVGSPGDSGGQFAWYSAQSLANVTNAVQQAALARGSRVPVLWGLDAVRGASLVKGAAMFPAAIGLAATFDPHHAYSAGRVAAKDTRAAGYQCAFGPSADLAVDKRWAQTFLSFGEDPALAAEMVAHTVRGYQGDYKTDRQRVACCLRGFVGAGSGQPSGGRRRSAPHIPDAQLLEYHLPGFDAAVAAGVAALMQAPGALNGEDLGSSQFYLRALLRDRLHFRGVMVADEHAVGARQKLRAAEDPRDAVFLALNNTSVDVEDDMLQGFAPMVRDLVRGGRLAEDRVTESCARILQLKKDLGLFERPFADPALSGLVGARQDIDAAQDAVRDSLTLLRNNGVLPLAAGDRVLFVGPHLNSTALLGGGWNVHAQGPTPAEGDVVFEGAAESVMAAVRRVAGASAPIAYHRGFQLTAAAPPGADAAADYAQLVRLARQADKIVVALGEAPYAGQGADLGELALDPRQIELVRALHHDVPRPLAAVVVAGRPRLLKEVGDIADAVLLAYLPGALGGLPVAEALYGKFSPSGRLPVTYPLFEAQARDTIWQGVSGNYAPAWPFGAGRGYSTLSYSNITADADTIRPGHPLTVRVTVHNQGPLDQKEPVLLFTAQQFRTGYEPELLRLRAFHKPTIRAGTATEISFTVTAEELAYHTRDLRRVVDPSKVNITINAFSPSERSLTVSLLP